MTNESDTMNGNGSVGADDSANTDDATDWLADAARGLDETGTRDFVRGMIGCGVKLSRDEFLALSAPSARIWLEESRNLRLERDMEIAGMLLDPEAHAVRCGQLLYGDEFVMDWVAQKNRTALEGD